MSEYVAVWDGSRWVSIRGDKGDPGKTLAIKGVKATVAELPVPGVEGDLWIVSATGDGYVWEPLATPPAYLNVGRIQGPAGPQGAKGDKGDKGDDGSQGLNAAISVGTVATGLAGTSVKISNSGTSSSAILNFTIPKGDKGEKGDKGDKGDTGADGASPTLTVLSTKDAAAGDPAAVTITSTGTNAYGLAFEIPKGATGAAGTGLNYKGVATTWPPTSPAAGDLWQIGSPAPTGAPAPAGHIVSYDGTAWKDGGMIRGEKGDAGPTKISTDKGNVAQLGTDSLLFVPAGSTPIATTTTLGGVIVGKGLSVDATGLLDVKATDDATTTTSGIVKLADATAITNKSADRVITADQLVAQVATRAAANNPTLTGVVTIPVGTALVPSLICTGDSDTGLFLKQAGSLAVSSNGTEVIVFGSKVTITGNAYPSTHGNKGNVLTTDGAGTLSWTDLGLDGYLPLKGGTLTGPVSATSGGKVYSLLPTVSSDAGNLTKLGTDGYVYTSVASTDVSGLGTIATKGSDDYLSIKGGTLTGLVSATSGGKVYSLLPTVSADADNLTKLGSDGYIYTSVASTDVSGLGTIATKASTDYLPIKGGTLTGDLTVSNDTTKQPTLIVSSAEMSSLLQSTATQARLELTSFARGTKSSSWEIVNAADNTLQVGVLGATPTNGVAAISLNCSQFESTTLGDRVSVRWPAYFDRQVNVLNTLGNSSVIRVDGPSSNGSSINLTCNKGAVASITMTGPVHAWSYSVQADGSFRLGSTVSVDAIWLNRGATTAASTIKLGWPTLLLGGVTDGIKFNNTSNSVDRLDAYEEGTWVPSYTADTPLNITITSSGAYTRIGRMVHCTGYIQASALLLRSTGNLRVSGLPFPRAVGSNANGSIGIANNWGTTVPIGMTNDPVLTNAMLLYDLKHLLDGAAGMPIVQAGALQPNSLLHFSITYFTNT